MDSEGITVVPEASPPPLKHIRWCDGHWAELLEALKVRGLSNQIAPDSDALTQKLAQGKTDPLWEAHNLLNLRAFEFFGPDKIVDENGGCPVCTFANIVQHMADLMVLQHGETH